ncbi:solute carrier organic anion transporter family member 1B1-like [Glandiceps talaboti]
MLINARNDDNGLSDTKPSDSDVIESESSSCCCIRDMRVFVAIIFCVKTIYHIGYASLFATLTTIERRYGLSASQQGFLGSAFEIGTLCTLPFISYFLGKRTNHRPRWLSFGVALMGIGYIILALPHFLSQPYQYDKAGNFSLGGGSPEQGLCSARTANDSENEDCTEERLAQTKDGEMAYILFIIGQVIEGIGYGFMFSLSYSYIDDYSGKRSAVYLGLIDGTMGVGAPLGFGVITPYFLTKYVDFHRVDLSDINIDDTDPRWVGAWWISVLIYSPFLLALSIPLFFFPKQLLPMNFMNDQRDNQEEGQTEDRNFWLRVKGLFVAALGLIRNPIFMLAAIAYTINVPVGLGYFLPRYLQKDLGYTASMANLIVALLWIFPNFPTAVATGILIKKMKLSMLGLTKFMLILVATIIITNSLAITIPCEGPYLEGTRDGQTMDLSCNAQCECSLDHYQPVCGSNGLMYYSPCYAGCTNAHSDKNFTNCGCIESDITKLEDTFAYDGLCESPLCKYLAALLAVMSIFAIANSATSLPSVMMAMRSVHPDQKSFAVGIRSTIISLYFFITPLIAGALIDATCILWREECDERGACAQYDNFMYRMLYLSASAALSGLSFGILMILLCVLKRRKVKGDPSSMRTFRDKDKSSSGIQLKSIKDTGQDNLGHTSSIIT